MAKKIFTKNLGLKDGNTCTICIEEFKDKQSRVSITPCLHIFHYKCLSNWLINNSINPKCPNCNYNLLKDFNKQVNKEILNINANNNIDVISTQGQNLRQPTSINENNNNLNSEENMNDTRILRGRQPNRTNNNNHNNTINRNRVSRNTNTNGNQNRGDNNNGIQEIEIYNV